MAKNKKPKKGTKGKKPGKLKKGPKLKAASKAPAKKKSSKGKGRAQSIKPIWVTRDFVLGVMASYDPPLTPARKGLITKGLNSLIGSVPAIMSNPTIQSSVAAGKTPEIKLDPERSTVSLDHLMYIVEDGVMMDVVRQGSHPVGDKTIAAVQLFVRAANLQPFRPAAG